MNRFKSADSRGFQTVRSSSNSLSHVSQYSAISSVDKPVHNALFTRSLPNNIKLGHDEFDFWVFTDCKDSIHSKLINIQCLRCLTVQSLIFMTMMRLVQHIITRSFGLWDVFSPRFSFFHFNFSWKYQHTWLSCDCGLLQSIRFHTEFN